MSGSSKKQKSEEESFDKIKTPRTFTSPQTNKKFNFDVILMSYSFISLFLQTHNIFKSVKFINFIFQEFLPLRPKCIKFCFLYDLESILFEFFNGKPTKFDK
jgi:hypothetical protein